MKLGLITIAILFSNLAFGQTIAISGKVFESKDYDKNVVQGAAIELLNEEGIILGTSESNEKGFFEVFIPAYYRYSNVKFYVSAPGYQGYRRTESLKFNDNDIFLTKLKETNSTTTEPKEKDKAPEEASKLIEDLAERDREIDELRHDLDLTTQDLKRKETENENLGTEYELLKEQRDALIDRLEAKEETRISLENELKKLDDYAGIVEGQRDYYKSEVKKRDSIEADIQNMYISYIEIFSADDKNGWLSNEPKKTDKFKKWERTIVEFQIEQENGLPLENEKKFQIKIKHIKSGKFLKYAEGGGNEECTFYYKSGRKQVIFSNYESKYDFVNDPEFMVILYYGTELKREMRKKKIRLKN